MNAASMEVLSSLELGSLLLVSLSFCLSLLLRLRLPSDPSSVFSGDDEKEDASFSTRLLLLLLLLLQGGIRWLCCSDGTSTCTGTVLNA